LRGMLYNAQKHQGRKGEATSGQNGQKWTDETLAQKFGVSARTVRRDADFATAVQTLISTCKDHARRLLFAPPSGMKPRHFLALTKKKPAEQKALVGKLLANKIQVSELEMPSKPNSNTVKAPSASDTTPSREPSEVQRNEEPIREESATGEAQSGTSVEAKVTPSGVTEQSEPVVKSSERRDNDQWFNRLMTDWERFQSTWGKVPDDVRRRFLKEPQVATVIKALSTA
jgi:hypothetical protein